MRITSISLFVRDDEAPMKFDLRNVESQTQYIIRNIIGIDVEELTPRFYGFSSDGTKRFYDFKLKPREIVMRIVINPRFKLNEDYSDLRDAIYRAISSTRTGDLKLQFHAGASTIAETYGHIIRMEVAHFAQTPELQITLKCNDPMLRGINPVVMLEEDLPASTNPVILADNVSTAPHGFKFQITFTASKADFTVQDKSTDPEWVFKVIPASTFLSGDVLHFSSEFNNRYLYMVRSAVTTHLLDKIVPTSVWPIMFPGFNEFHFVDLAQFDWDELSFTSAYWGV